LIPASTTLDIIMVSWKEINKASAYPLPIRPFPVFANSAVAAKEQIGKCLSSSKYSEWGHTLDYAGIVSYNCIKCLCLV